MRRSMWGALLGAAAVLSLMAGACGAAETAKSRPLLRISTENPADHVHTRIVARFAQTLQARVGDRLEVIHEHGAVLFRDRDVIHALRQGQVEMAVPGTWQLDRFVPAVGVFLLPAFYGLDAKTSHALRDGSPGTAISRAIEERLDVVVAGRWIDLGFAHIYTTAKAVQSHRDLEGLIIRIPGGEANAVRLRALGMTPVVVPWPDLSAALKSGKLDGVMTTHETAASGRLWELGLTHVFEDRQYFAQYVPLISGRFWNRLPGDLKNTIRETWEDQVTLARIEAAAAQTAGRTTLVSHGITMVTPTDADLTARRLAISAEGSDAAQTLDMNPALIAEFLKGVEPAP